MGQRSQIYIRYNMGDKKGLIANYYGWNYGERMISRAKWGINYIINCLNLSYYNPNFYTDKDNSIKLSRIFDTNFDMLDVAISCDIIKEYKEYYADENFNDSVFLGQDNNDGKLFVDICSDCVKYAFLNRDADFDNIMDGEAYMCWDYNNDWRKNKYLSKDEVKTCEENIKFINDNAILMTKEELIDFIEYDYEV